MNMLRVFSHTRGGNYQWGKLEKVKSCSLDTDRSSDSSNPVSAVQIIFMLLSEENPRTTVILLLSQDTSTDTQMGISFLASNKQKST